jgi:hypothetical protein
MQTEHPLGIKRAGLHLKKLRMAATKRSPARHKVGWHVDRWTATRIRIGQILKRHPEFTGMQVMAKIGPESPVRVRWIWQVMSEYTRATGRPKPLARRKGRQFYSRRPGPELPRRSRSAASQRIPSRAGCVRDTPPRQTGRWGTPISFNRAAVSSSSPFVPTSPVPMSFTIRKIFCCSSRGYFLVYAIVDCCRQLNAGDAGACVNPAYSRD